ncbi:MAG: biopolymer transporter ExbD [Opitutales bacterium]
MAKKRSLFPGDGEPELSISALIDVAFLLLIYFIVSTTLEKQEADLNLSLPGTRSSSVAPVQIDPMRISIENDGSIRVNQEVTDTNPEDRRLPVLTGRLRRFAASAELTSSKALIVVDCADDVHQQRFIDVLNACQNAGLKNITLSQ